MREVVPLADYSRQILKYFQQPTAQPLRPKELARLLRVKATQAAEFLADLKSLIEEGRLQRTSNGRVGLARPAWDTSLTGTIRRTPRGVGYFTPAVTVPEGSDSALAPVQVQEPIYIAPEDLEGALTGDEVRIVLLKRRRSHGQRCGRVVEVLRRARTTFVGIYHEHHGQGYVTVDAALFDEPVAVGDPGAKGARPNDKVVFEMVQYPTSRRGAEGVITQVLGPHGKPGIDTLSIIHEFQLPDEFPEAVLEEARAQAARFDPDDLQDRLDLTGETIITIDPVDARDFDDAISLSQDERGHWRLGVHIADVSHFVPAGSALDREARRRGNSVYLPDRVLPMLPEVLSNGLASLQQDHLRYTKSVFIDFTPEGIPTHTELAHSAIKVTQRFSYEEVFAFLQHPHKHGKRLSSPVRTLLERMHQLAMILRRRRFEQGALDLQIPEVKLDLDRLGQVIGAHQVPHDESHQIIEEFMLAANMAVARMLSERGLPYLHRVHAPPDEKKLRDLGEFVRGLGLSARPWLGRHELQRLLEQVRGQPTEYPVSYALLRSLKQAEYSPADIGHFALATEDYCHFTSPIRRYPDLTVHRLVDAVLRHPSKVKTLSETELVKLGEHCSLTERRAEAAERELIKVKLLAFLSTRLGWQMDATITGVERFGLFCLGRELPAEGLVHISTLPADQYEYDAQHHTLQARRRGTLYRLGDVVRVEVAAVDLHRRQLELVLVSEPKASRRRSRSE